MTDKHINQHDNADVKAALSKTIVSINNKTMSARDKAVTWTILRGMLDSNKNRISTTLKAIILYKNTVVKKINFKTHIKFIEVILYQNESLIIILNDC
jgi:fructose-bisphosphate aldolase class 1